MNQRTKTLLIGGTLLVGSFGPAVTLAQTTATPAKTQAQKQTREPSFTGSIPLPQNDRSEGAEAATYGSMATVSLDQAVKAAQNSLGATDAPTSVQLGDEDGFLIWEVVIGNQAVKVDAGNAKVLQTEQAGVAEEADDNKFNDQGDDQADDQEGQAEGDESDSEQDQEGAREEQNEGGAEDGS